MPGILAKQQALIYMSIRHKWLERVVAGELVRLTHLFAGRPEKRVVLLSPELDALLSDDWGDDAASQRFARLRADLEAILAGDPIVVCWEPRKARQRHQIGRLAPPEDDVFDIRSVDPEPGLRVLFHFAEKDVLVLHICHPRSVQVSWMHRLPLQSSKSWRRAVNESKARWSILFPNNAPHHGVDIHDYLSNVIVG